MRCKFRLTSVTQHEGMAQTLRFYPVYDERIAEDKRFAQATPSGNIEMYVTNPVVLAHVKPGQDYYVDFTLVE